MMKTIPNTTKLILKRQSMKVSTSLWKPPKMIWDARRTNNQGKKCHSDTLAHIKTTMHKNIQVAIGINQVTERYMGRSPGWLIDDAVKKKYQENCGLAFE